MNKPKGEAIVMMFDVGKTVETTKSGSESFFSRAQKCLALILKRKIWSNSPDHIALLLMGSDDTDETRSDENYPNICYKFELQEVAFPMLEYVESRLKPTNNFSDWIDGLIVAMNYLRDTDHASKRIVLMSDFSDNISDDNVSPIMDKLKELEIDLLIIGPDHFSDVGDYEPSNKKPKLEDRSELEKASSQLIREMQTRMEGALRVCTFDIALRELSVLPPPKVRKTPWNAVMEIGSIRINIAGLLKVKPNPRSFKLGAKPSDDVDQNGATPGPWQGSSGTQTTAVARDREMTYTTTDANGDVTQKVHVTPAEVTTGHRYGTTIVPFNESDKTQMKYKAGTKGLSVLGFTRIDSFNRGLLVGENCNIIVPRDRDSDSEVALSALIQAMNQMNVAAVARKVYSDDRGLSLVLLTPIDETVENDDGRNVQKQCLVVNEIPYKEDVKSLVFPSLNAELTEQQLSAMDQFIDSLDLMKAADDFDGTLTEAFKISNIREPKKQFYEECAMERGLGRPIPKDIHERFKPSHQLSASFKKKQDECIQKLKEFFPLTTTVPAEGTSSAIPGVVEEQANHEQESNQPELDHPKPVIDPSDPIPVIDIKTLFRDYCFPHPRALEYIVSQNLLEFSDKKTVLDCLLQCIKNLREFSLEQAPKQYNEWISDFAKAVTNKEVLEDFVETEAKVKYGLITIEENCKHGVTIDTARLFQHARGSLHVERVLSQIPINSQDLVMNFAPAPNMLEEEEEEMLDEYF